MEQATTVKVSLKNPSEGQALFGPQDKFLHLIEREVQASIFTREAEIVIQARAPKPRVSSICLRYCSS